MPREVFLEPSGSPFVHNTQFEYADQSMAGDSTLTDLSFQGNDNLLNESGFAGLADVTMGGMDDDTSLMKMQGSGNASEDMLMGIKGDEFLEDDSMAFELSKSTAPTQPRPEPNESPVAVPPPVAPPVEEEKPKGRRSTRSRSSSPSKKRSSAATTPVVEETTVFVVSQMETMQEEPEPEPEPKLRRSPRKARSTSTRLGASVSASVSPFASTSSSPAPENPLPTETTRATEPEPEPEPKTRRASRVVGRSKSKSRAKSAKVEEPLSEEPKVEEPTPVAGTAASTPVVEREVSPFVRETTTIARDTTPIPPRETTPVPPQHQATPPAPSPFAQNTFPTASQSLSPAAQTSQIPIQPTSLAASPDAPPSGSRLSLATRQSLAPTPVSQQSLAPTPATSSFPTGRQSLAPTPGPAPFKFNLPPSFGRRAQSLAPAPAFPTTPGFPATPSFATISTPIISNPVSALPSPALALTTPGPATAPRHAAPEAKEDELKYEQLSKEEEEEAIAAAMRITRRDSSIFAAMLSPARPSLAPKPKLPAEVQEEQEEQEERVSLSPNTIEEAPPTEPPKRTRVGRVSARVKGGAGVAVAVMGRVDEDTDMERVEPRVEPQGQEQEHALGEQHELEQEQERDILEEEKHIIGGQQDTTIPVNFSSRSPSPTPPPPPPPPEESGPSVNVPPKNGPKPRTRTTRASMPTVQPARVTRSTRRSEVQPPTSRGVTKAKETLIEKLVEMEIDEDARNDNIEPAEDGSTPTRAVDLPTDATAESIDSPNLISAVPHDVISSTPADSPVVSAPEEQAPALSKATVPKKAPGTKAPQRVLTRTVSAAAVPQQSTSGSGLSQPQPQPRRTVSSGSTKPASTGSAKPPSAGVKPASTEGSQQQAGRPAQKPTSTKPTAPRKPTSNTNQPPSVGHKENAVDKEPSPIPEPVVPAKELEPEVRAVRELPKRASQSSKVPTIIEDSMEISRDEISVDISDEPSTPVHYTASTSTAGSIWPREPAPNPFAPVKATVLPNEGSSATNKRRAPSPESEPGSGPQDAGTSDSPNKRVRFTAVLEAGPTPGIGRVARMPKPSLKKIKKIKLERKSKITNNATRPKRVLTRDWVVGGDMPSYAAPLKRDVREREPAPVERPSLTESQSISRPTGSKANLTVPIPFTFRSELRMKPRSIDESLPGAIPLAAPMPDFVAAHAAAEAANLARRQRAHELFLVAQAELEAHRDSQFNIGGETARRAAERAVFDAATKVKEAEAERVRNEQKRMQAEKEAAEIRELRRRMVPKANPMPEFYRHAPRTETHDAEE
ncbi:unnamed protein product [Rhizoctonia solani]|uniref:TPX2 C-terminal domain-containing protein n=2 Tax=Rhizoctonia solani TaxID=456999 RepID=A0A8H2XF47_9AGAM|nr:unnamed protein product [Rhizoctonia solani]